MIKSHVVGLSQAIARSDMEGVAGRVGTPSRGFVAPRAVSDTNRPIEQST